MECRIPGADANTYFAFAGTIAGGLYGIRHELELGEPYVGNGYEADRHRTHPVEPARRDRPVGAVGRRRGSASATTCTTTS